MKKILALLITVLIIGNLQAQTSNNEILIHINSIKGNDINDGSYNSPLKTLPAAAKKINKLPDFSKEILLRHLVYFFIRNQDIIFFEKKQI